MGECYACPRGEAIGNLAGRLRGARSVSGLDGKNYANRCPDVRGVESVRREPVRYGAAPQPTVGNALRKLWLSLECEQYFKGAYRAEQNQTDTFGFNFDESALRFAE